MMGNDMNYLCNKNKTVQRIGNYIGLLYLQQPNQRVKSQYDIFIKQNFLLMLDLQILKLVKGINKKKA